MDDIRTLTFKLADNDQIEIEYKGITDKSGQEAVDWNSLKATRIKDGVIQGVLTDNPAAFLLFFIKNEGRDIYKYDWPIEMEHRERAYKKIKAFLGEYAWYVHYGKGVPARFSRKPDQTEKTDSPVIASGNESEIKTQTVSSDPIISIDSLSSAEKQSRSAESAALYHPEEDYPVARFDRMHPIIHGSRLKSTQLYTRPHFVKEAREDVFSELDEAFQESHVVFLHGMGGIGKSEAAKQWAKLRQQNYDTIVFAQLNHEKKQSSILQLIIDDSVFVISGEFLCRSDYFLTTRQEETDEAYFHRKLAKIKQLSNNRTLIIIDNYDLSDGYLINLLDGEYHLLITTRNLYEGHEYPVVEVREIEDIDQLKKVFFLNLDGRRNDISTDDPLVEQLIELVSRHTLAIELLAKSLIHSTDTLQELNDKIVNSQRGLSIENVDSKVRRSLTGESISPFEIILSLFDVSMLKTDADYEYKVQVLVFLSAMPIKGVEEWLIRKWCDNNTLEALNSLIERSWLRKDDNGNVTIISMHSLIREVVWHELKPSLDKCSIFEERFIYDDREYIEELYHQPMAIKEQYYSIAGGLLAAFPLSNLEHFYFYCKIQRILAICRKVNNAYSLALGLQQILEKESKTESWEYGYIQLRIGSIYISLLRQNDKGYPYLIKAEKILYSYAKTNHQVIWLFLLYREFAIALCRDLEREDCNHSPNQVEEYLHKCKIIADELLSQGYIDRNLVLFDGFSCIWRSRVAIYRGELALAEKQINEAETFFVNHGYYNRFDKAAIFEVKAKIQQSKKMYDKEITFLSDLLKTTAIAFGKNNIPYILRTIDLAIAFIHVGNYDMADKIINECLGDASSIFYEHPQLYGLMTSAISFVKSEKQENAIAALVSCSKETRRFDINSSCASENATPADYLN